MFFQVERGRYSHVRFESDVEKDGQIIDTQSDAQNDAQSDTPLEFLEAVDKNARSTVRSVGPFVRFFAIMVVCFTGGLLIDTPSRRFDSETHCPRWSSMPSPVLDQINTSVHKITYNGSFLYENIFRQPASPEVDAAWTSMGIDYRSLRVSEEDAANLGWELNHVRISEVHGGGYPANVEGLHHLHCLNLLRQSLYYNYDYYHSKGEGAFQNADHIVQRHVSHCLDILRQQLMCQPDTGLLGQIWWDPHDPKPFVDFNTVHKCKDFTSLREWAKAQQLAETVPSDFLEPPRAGIKVFDAIL